MGGGPSLDGSGQLVGSDGRLKFPPQRIEVFTCVDGSRPSPPELEQMHQLSWGLPLPILGDRSLWFSWSPQVIRQKRALK